MNGKILSTWMVTWAICLGLVLMAGPFGAPVASVWLLMMVPRLAQISDRRWRVIAILPASIAVLVLVASLIAMHAVVSALIAAAVAAIIGWLWRAWGSGQPADQQERGAESANAGELAATLNEKD